MCCGQGTRSRGRGGTSGSSQSTLLQRCPPAHPRSCMKECSGTGVGSRLVVNGALVEAEVLEGWVALVEAGALGATNNYPDT